MAACHQNETSKCFVFLCTAQENEFKPPPQPFTPLNISVLLGGPQGGCVARMHDPSFPSTARREIEHQRFFGLMDKKRLGFRATFQVARGPHFIIQVTAAQQKGLTRPWFPAKFAPSSLSVPKNLSEFRVETVRVPSTAQPLKTGSCPIVTDLSDDSSLEGGETLPITNFTC